MKYLLKKSNEIKNALRLIAPGQGIHDAIEYIIKGQLGALIVINTNNNMSKIISGGFKLNISFKPEYLWELAKMDGAIILSKNAEKIITVNAHLLPSPSIETSETGTRHRTAERVAKQTNNLVIAISSRRNSVSIYINSLKYVLQDIPILLSKTTQILLIIEKHKLAFDKLISNFDGLELRNAVQLYDVCIVLHRFFMILQLEEVLDFHLMELGEYGEYISKQFKEIMLTIAEAEVVIKDYIKNSKKIKSLEERNKLLSSEFISLYSIALFLGYKDIDESLEIHITPRGYRLLDKKTHLTENMIEKLVKKFKGLTNIQDADIKNLTSIGLTKNQAQTLKEDLTRFVN